MWLRDIDGRVLALLVCGCHAASPNKASLPPTRDAAVQADASPPVQSGSPGYKLAFDRPMVGTCWGYEHESDAIDEKLDALDRQIEALGPRADASAAYVELLRLLEDPCFALATGEGIPLAPENGLAMRTWWRDGGELWVRHYLHLSESSEPRTAVVPPTMRRTLTPQTHRKHPFERWLCPVGKPECADETEMGYRKDFIADMHLTSTGLGALSTGPNDHEGTTIEFNWGACEETAALADEEHRYAAFRDCIELATPRHWDLPIGGFRAPERGWLVVQGRRGHYTYCDQLSLFDLSTGASYQSELCGGILCVGGDDRCETPEYKWRRGNVDPPTVRAALWAMMWGGEAEAGVVRHAAIFDVPEKMEARRPGRPEYRADGRTGWSSNHTQLTWSYGVDGKHGFDGMIGWPNGGGHGGLDYAADQLKAMEATFEEGCPKASFPDIPLFARAYGVSPIDAHPAAVAVTQQKLVDTLRADAAKPCDATGSD